MSQVAVAGCPEGIALAAESMVVSGDRSYRLDAQKVIPLGPRLAFAGVGHAALFDPRAPRQLRDVNAYLAELTNGFQAQGEPAEDGRRLARFFVELLGQLAQYSRLWPHFAHLGWNTSFIVAGYAREATVGVVSVWSASVEGAILEAEWTTDDHPRAAIGVINRTGVAGSARLARMGRHAEDAGLAGAVREVVRLVERARDTYPEYCGGQIHAATITPAAGVAWLAGYEPPEPDDDWREMPRR